MIEYRIVPSSRISRALFRSFNRDQKVSRCWRKIEGRWVLKDIAFEERWNAEHFDDLVCHLKHTTETGGTVFGAFEEDALVGFASVESERFGAGRDYVQLSCLHVSCEHRGRGIGKALFRLSADRAREIGAKKLYISAHSSEESQAFYKAMGCVEALEYNQRLTDAEPCDCQLECPL